MTARHASRLAADMPAEIIAPRAVVRRARRENLPQIAAWPECPGRSKEGLDMTPARHIAVSSRPAETPP